MGPDLSNRTATRLGVVTLTKHPTRLSNGGQADDETIPVEGTSHGNATLNSGDCVSNLAVKPPEHADGALESTVGLHDKYARGALSIIINFDANPRTSAREIGPILVGPENLPPTFRMENGTCVVHNLVRGALRGAQDWRDSGMFIRIIEMVEIAECCTTASGEGFRPNCRSLPQLLRSLPVSNSAPRQPLPLLQPPFQRATARTTEQDPLPQQRARAGPYA